MKHLLLAGLCLAVMFCAAAHAVDLSGILHVGAHGHGLLSAMGAAPMLRNSSALFPLRRGIQSVRSETDASAEVKRLIEDLTKSVAAKFEAQNKAWDTFKTENNAASDGMDDAKVAKINKEIGDLGKEMDALNVSIAALRLGEASNAAGGAPRASLTTEEKAYRTAFSGRGGYLRRGNADNLGELAIKASLSSDSNPDGGYTVTPELDTAISRIQQAVCAMRGLAQVMTISTNVHKKMVSQGGAGYGWVGERDARPSTNTPTLAEIAFTAMELYANPAATQALLDDSAVNIEEWLANEVAITFAEQEGSAFVNGDGNNKPRGFLAYTNVADTSYAWGSLGYLGTGNSAGFASSNPADNLVDLCYLLKQGYRINASWIMNRKTQGAARKFKDTTGNYIWLPGLVAGQPATILGYPVADDDNMPDLASGALPVAFGDFKRGYMIVDRIGVRVLRDPYSNKPYIQFYTTKRVGGGVQNFEAIKLLKCV